MPKAKQPHLTSALEDYLETIFEFIQLQGFVRVKDIVKARNVKAGSVSPAMKRLDEMGLINYERREYIKLTEEGEAMAREIFSRHQVLTRFFHEVLKMDESEAIKNACAMEHSFTSVAKDHLVLFMEYLLNCPQVKMEHWERFHDCHVDNVGGEGCAEHPDTECVFCRGVRMKGGQHVHLNSMQPGAQGEIRIIEGTEEQRREILNLGVIPGTRVEIRHYYPGKEFTEISLNGMTLKFPSRLGALVLVETQAEPESLLSNSPDSP